MLDINTEVKVKLFVSAICLQSKIIVEKQSREENLYRASPPPQLIVLTNSNDKHCRNDSKFIIQLLKCFLTVKTCLTYLFITTTVVRHL